MTQFEALASLPLFLCAAFVLFVVLVQMGLIQCASASVQSFCRNVPGVIRVTVYSAW